jgi:hypothetical protein
VSGREQLDIKKTSLRAERSKPAMVRDAVLMTGQADRAPPAEMQIFPLTGLLRCARNDAVLY